MQTNAKNFSGDGVSDIVVQIEQLLRKNFINKSQLAAYLGINPATVSRWMSGKCRPRNEHLIRLKAHPLWDTSMLTGFHEILDEPKVSAMTGNNSPVNIGSGHQIINNRHSGYGDQYTALAVKIKELQTENRMLKEENIRLKETNDKLWSIINKMTHNEALTK